MFLVYPVLAVENAAAGVVTVLVKRMLLLELLFT
jgi:hypothetical protein